LWIAHSTADVSQVQRLFKKRASLIQDQRSSRINSTEDPDDERADQIRTQYWDLTQNIERTEKRVCSSLKPCKILLIWPRTLQVVQVMDDKLKASSARYRKAVKLSTLGLPSPASVDEDKTSFQLLETKVLRIFYDLLQS
jgi:hypothetical protein